MISVTQPITAFASELEAVQAKIAGTAAYVVELYLRIYAETDAQKRSRLEETQHRLNVGLRPWRQRQAELIRLMGGAS